MTDHSNPAPTPGTPLTPKAESEAWREFQASMPRTIFGKRRQQIEDATMRYAAAVRLLDRERRERVDPDLRARIETALDKPPFGMSANGAYGWEIARKRVLAILDGADR